MALVVRKGGGDDDSAFRVWVLGVLGFRIYRV